MLIATEVLLAMRCPECGKLEFHSFSRFTFSGHRTVRITCSCGNTKLVISTKNHKNFWLQVPCIICETKHLVSLPAVKIWSKEITTIYCEETGLELAHLGPAGKIKKLARDGQGDVEALVDDFSGDNYFNNPEVMYETLNCLHDIADRGALYCQCGNRHITVDIFPDRLELYCAGCDSLNIIYAETEEDLEVIRQVGSIELTRHGFQCLDALRNQPEKQ